MRSKHFRKLPRSILALQSQQGQFHAAAEAIAAQVENRRCEVVAARIERVPVEAQVIYWLWRFACEAGVCGLDAFLLDSLGVYSPRIHGALEIVGAHDLMKLLEEAVAHARRGSAEFVTLRDRSWFEQFTPVPQYPTLESVNGPTFNRIRELTGRVATYMKENRSVLFGG
jgi:hypothetical protein